MCDTNVAYDNFFSTLQLCYDKSFPLTRLSRRAYRDRKWRTKGLKVSHSKKDKLYKIWLVTSSDIVILINKDMLSIRNCIAKLLGKRRPYIMISVLMLRLIVLKNSGIT